MAVFDCVTYNVTETKLNFNVESNSLFTINFILKLLLLLVGVIFTGILVFTFFVAFPNCQAEVFRCQETAKEAAITHDNLYNVPLEVNRLIHTYGMGYLDFIQLQVPDLVHPDCEPPYGFLLPFMRM